METLLSVTDNFVYFSLGSFRDMAFVCNVKCVVKAGRNHPWNFPRNKSQGRLLPMKRGWFTLTINCVAFLWDWGFLPSVLLLKSHYCVVGSWQASSSVMLLALNNSNKKPCKATTFSGQWMICQLSSLVSQICYLVEIIWTKDIYMTVLWLLATIVPNNCRVLVKQNQKNCSNSESFLSI